MIQIRSTFRTLIGSVAILALATSLVAGPPTVCHPVQTPAKANLIPVGENLAPDSSYDRERLIADTLKILTPDQDVLVRMEALRRATLYVNTDDQLAFHLWAALQARVLKSEAAGTSDAMAWFDAGYLAQTYAQIGVFRGLGDTFPSGYEWVLKSRALVKDEAQGAKVDFALALMTSYLKVPGKKWGPHRDHEDHLRAAVSHTEAGTLLARNLEYHFKDTIKSLKVKYAGPRG